MSKITSKHETMHCPEIGKKAKIKFDFVVIENEIISPPHMRGCDLINDCDVITLGPNGISTYDWEKCPIYQKYQ